MSLKSMHEAQKQQNPPQSSLNTELIQQQMQRISEQEQEIQTLRENIEQLQAAHNEELNTINRQTEERIAEIQENAEAMNAESNRRLSSAKRLKFEFNQRLNTERNYMWNRLQEESAMVLKQQRIKLTLYSTAVSVALTKYAVVCTGLLMLEYVDVLKTIPIWFVNRKDNLSTAQNGMIFLNHWLNQSISEITYPTAARIISLLMCIVIVAGFLTGSVYLIRKIVMAFKKQWKSLTVQRKAVLISLTTAALLVGVVLAERMTAITLNVVSWWIVLAGGMNGIFYRVNSRR